MPAGLVVRDDETQGTATLTPAEISELDLDAGIVVMSACTTSTDPDASGGDGLGGLTAAFLSAGARNVVATHWPVVSEAAPLVTVPMFQLLAVKSHVSAAAALRDAMLTQILDDDEPQYSHPAYWAAYFLVGDGRVGVQ